MLDITDLEKIPHGQICDHAREKFITVYNAKFGSGGEAFFEEQKALFNNELMNGSYKDMLARASSFSILNAFMWLAINNLSLEKDFTTNCYLECRSQKIGEDANHRYIYQFNAVITVTGYGEVILRQRARQIKGIDTPRVVYDCDSFRFGERDGRSYVEYEKCMPRPTGARLVACYTKITKPDGSYDYFVLDAEGILRLKGYSQKFNGGKYANKLYGSNPDCSDIDTGFLISKTIKHAFKGYPKLSLGDGAALEADKDSDGPKDEQPQSFAGHQTEGVKIDTEDDSPFNE